MGRAVSISVLRVLSFNVKAASSKHSDVVYEFYERDFFDFQDDISYSNQRAVSAQSSGCISVKASSSESTPPSMQSIPGLQIQTSCLKRICEVPQFRKPILLPIQLDYPNYNHLFISMILSMRWEMHLTKSIYPRSCCLPVKCQISLISCFKKSMKLSVDSLNLHNNGLSHSVS